MDFDIANLLSNPVAFAAAIVAITAFTRKHLLPNLDGNLVIFFSITLALAMRFLLPLIPTAFLNDVIGTIIVAISASGGVDAARNLAKQASRVQPVIVKQ